MARAAASVTLILVTLVTGVGAQRVPPGPLPSVAPPLLLRLEGVVAASREAAKPAGFAVVSLGFLGHDEHRWLAVTKARTVGGDQPLDGKDVLALLAPFTPNLKVTGSEALVARLREAPPGTPVRVEGLVHRGSGLYQLRSVEAGGS